MTYLAAGAVLGWLIYSWKIAAGLGILCLFIAMFYSAAFDGHADDKAKRALCWAILIMSVAMIGIITGPHFVDPDAPRYCTGVAC